MTNRKQYGFSVVEVILVIVLLGLIVASGYFLVKRSHGDTASSSTPTTAAKSIPSAPTVESASDLTTADTTLDEADLDVNSADSTELDSQIKDF
jgi:prepilin-type N-terminal cleavage/methylation domain-containing protein